jgi:hypothetical protein
MGGAIFNDGGTLTVENSTLSGNAALGGAPGAGGTPAATAGQGLGGGIFARNGTVTIHHATLSHNTAAQGGGSIYLLGDGQVVRTGDPTAVIYSVTNSMFANTTSDNGVTDAFVNTINAGAASPGTPANTHNLVEVNGAGANALPGVTQTGDPNLGPLGANGGPTPTHALLEGSPAIGTGDNAAVGGLTTDQRGSGFARVSGANCVVDIGAYEVQQPCGRPPALTLRPSIALWPPNHRYRTITVGQMVQSATDPDDGDLLNRVVIEQVTSDEPDNAPGDADGNTTNDIVIAGDCKSVNLRSERDETKNGRVYAVTLAVADSAGAVARARCSRLRSRPIGAEFRQSRIPPR